MTSKLVPLRLNELLGFVRLNHSASPNLPTFDSIIQRTHRRMVIQLSLASTFDSGARLSPFKQHQPSRLISGLMKIQDCCFNI
jgi:hypothetical protein